MDAPSLLEGTTSAGGQPSCSRRGTQAYEQQVVESRQAWKALA